MNKTEYFNYLKVARELKVPDSILTDIVRDAATEFPKDKMMFELHVLRAIKSLFWKKDENRRPTRRKRSEALAH